jgi:hypothetical protein
MTFDISKIAPELGQEQAKFDQLLARLAHEERILQQKAARLQNGPTQEERASNAALVLAGETPADSETEHRKQRELVFALRDAVDAARRALPTSRRTANKKLTDSIKPQHDKLQREMFSHLINAHAVWSRLFAMKRNVVNEGFWLNDLFSVDAEELLGVPSDSASEFNHLLREATKAGYCKAAQ